MGCEGHGEIAYKWRANDWENNLIGECKLEGWTDARVGVAQTRQNTAKVCTIYFLFSGALSTENKQPLTSSQNLLNYIC